ncbi:MAG: hypothetical protein AAF726_18370 [Planctomycetota bacterium]
MTLRQLRCYFGLHEMVERRRYTRRAERPLFTITELSRLVSGRGSETALAALRTDLRRLSALGLAHAQPHEITFPAAFGALESECSAYLDAVGEGRSLTRPVPVPRRLLRALAGGFRRADTLYIVATLLRSLFWKKREGCITTDGRIKSSWVAEHFGLSLRAVKGARAHLREIGWLRDLEAPHWLVQRYGAHTLVNVHWSPAGEQTADEVDTPGAVGEGRGTDPQGGSAPRTAESRGGSAPPRQDQNTPLKRNLNTRRPAQGAGPTGVLAKDQGGEGERGRGTEREGRSVTTQAAPPSIRDVQPHDLRATDRLLELYRQACDVGLAKGGEAGRMDFLSFAHRARARGNRPGAMLVWLLREQKREFITLSDEEAAARTVREHNDGPDTRASGHDGCPDALRSARDERGLSEDEQVVERCIRTAKDRRVRVRDPFVIARKVKGWSRERWETAYWSYQRTQAQQWV